MLGGNRIDNCEPQTHALAGDTRGHKWLGQAFKLNTTNTRPGVADPDRNFTLTV